ncbi:MAG: aldehyde ferredoxin oxidoreductase family protein [Spirochaetaceae bacterium]|nr:MAG: aldehyde ferredoxin oxidoreductase family protein [Spirochaetaceae bacterium]
MGSSKNAEPHRILRVDLSTSRTDVDTIPEDLIALYLGGRGLGAYLLYREVPAYVEPLSPKNKLIFLNGPLVGSLIPGSNKVNVTFKSPLTGTYSYSLCGGHWGPALRAAGFDGIIIRGKAERPVYLLIRDDTAELRNAEPLWGKTIPQTEEAIRRELVAGGTRSEGAARSTRAGQGVQDADLQIAAIGAAGENLVKYACITSGLYREFGRGGGGAVMGSKNLKAIAVIGSMGMEIHDPKAMMEVSARLYDKLKASPKFAERHEYGTAELVDKVNNRGFLPTRNFSQGFFEQGFRLEGPAMKKEIVTGNASCYACPIACGKITRVASRRYGTMIMEGPEFETIGLLGANCGIGDWESLVKATQICDENGMDTMSAGACLSLAMECVQRRILTSKDIGGLDLTFGNGEAAIAVLEMIAQRRGIGAVLAEGVKGAAERFGAPELAIHTKGLSPGAYDPRGAKGMALTYATSSKGAHHMFATTFGYEIAAGNRLEESGKGELQRNHQFSMCVVDTLGMCSTMRIGIAMEDMAEALQAVSGRKMTPEDLNLVAERVINLERMYNQRLGFSRKDDTLPERFMREAFEEGESAGQTVDLETLLDEYYRAMGWDENGIPTAQTLERLGLSEGL